MMRDIIQNWQGTDAELLAELNAKTIKRKVGDGMVTLAMIGDLGVEVASGVNLALETVLANMPETSPTEIATKSMLRRFLERLTVSDRGLDFHNDEVRGQLTGLLTLGGISSEVIDAVLSLGAVYESVAQQSLGRDAIQSDIDAVRSVIRREELQFAYQEGFASTIQPALQTGTQAEIVAAIQAVASAVEAL